MKVFIIIAVLVVLSAVVLTACAGPGSAVGVKRTFEVSSRIDSLVVKINAAEFIVLEADEFSVESNLKNLTVTENDGVLEIIDHSKISMGYNNAELKLYIPKNLTFESAEIKTGAGSFSADVFSANTMVFNSGAGQVEFDNLEVLNNINIKGGAGEISVKNATLNNLTLELGVGELDMTAKLLGESNLKFGVGESNLKLIGSKDDYSFDIKNGVGNITVDGENSALFANSTNGENLVKIKGGVGATNIEFTESAQ